jgi:hypothetical protein
MSWRSPRKEHGVGKSIGVEDLNQAAQVAQARFLGAFGLGFLDKSQTAPAA